MVLSLLVRLVARFPWFASSICRVSDSLEVVRCGDFLIAILRDSAERMPLVGAELDSDARMGRLAGWVRSGRVTWGEAEALLVLDETTPWESRGR